MPMLTSPDTLGELIYDLQEIQSFIKASVPTQGKQHAVNHYIEIDRGHVLS